MGRPESPDRASAARPFDHLHPDWRRGKRDGVDGRRPERVVRPEGGRRQPVRFTDPGCGCSMMTKSYAGAISSKGRRLETLQRTPVPFDAQIRLFGQIRPRRRLHRFGDARMIPGHTLERQHRIDRIDRPPHRFPASGWAAGARIPASIQQKKNDDRSLRITDEAKHPSGRGEPHRHMLHESSRVMARGLVHAIRRFRTRCARRRFSAT